MLDTKMTNVTVSLDPPTNPSVGDIHIAPNDGDGFEFFVWDGDMWRGLVIGDPMEHSETKEPEDTPEKAYDRAMGVVR